MTTPKRKKRHPLTTAANVLVAIAATVTTALLAVALVLAFINAPVLGVIMLVLILVIYSVGLEALSRAKAHAAQRQADYDRFTKSLMLGLGEDARPEQLRS